MTDEDVLEFVHKLQLETGIPKRLFEELELRSLLILGCSFGRWLARFFLRMAQRHQRLSSASRSHFVADDMIRGDESQVVFLKHFAKSTEVYTAGAVEFVDELHRRWSERYPPSGGESESPAAPAGPGAVFLSYASEDREAASRLRRALEEHGVAVFFDRKNLRVGENWAMKIRRAIRECSVFVPVISRNTLGGSGILRWRFFREEWQEACALTKRAALDDRFIVPVVIDDTSCTDDRLPKEFRKPQWDSMPGGHPSPQFLDDIRKLFQKHHGVTA